MADSPSLLQTCAPERSLKESCSKLCSLASILIFLHTQCSYLSWFCRGNWFESLACDLQSILVGQTFDASLNCSFLLRGIS